MLKIYLKVIRIILNAEMWKCMYHQGEIHRGKGRQLQMSFGCRMTNRCQRRIEGELRSMSTQLHKEVFMKKGNVNSVKFCRREKVKREREDYKLASDLVFIFQSYYDLKKNSY